MRIDHLAGNQSLRMTLIGSLALASCGQPEHFRDRGPSNPTKSSAPSAESIEVSTNASSSDFAIRGGNIWNPAPQFNSHVIISTNQSGTVGLCTGIVLDPNWVLTAASCLHRDVAHRVNNSNVLLKNAGAPLSAGEVFVYYGKNSFAPGLVFESWRGANLIVIPPTFKLGYDVRSRTDIRINQLNDDIALVRVTGNLDTMTPATLSSAQSTQPNFLNLFGRTPTGEVAGFGTPNVRDARALKLKSASVASVRVGPNVLNSNFSPVIVTNGASGEEGDQGGPLYFPAAAAGGRYVVAGIRSLDRVSPETFEPVGDHLSWISQYVQNLRTENTVAFDRIYPRNVAPMYRLYDHSAGSHFLTPSSAEYNRLLKDLPGQYRGEGIGFLAFNESMTPNATRPLAPSELRSPLIHLYNSSHRRHYYTTSNGEADALTASPVWRRGGAGVVPNGELFLPNIFVVTCDNDPGPRCSPAKPAGTVEIFKLYHRVLGFHFFTSSEGEKDAILRSGPGVWEQHKSLGYGPEL
jgi:hypothetical protein